MTDALTDLLLCVHLPLRMTNGNDGRGSKWFRAAKRRDEYREQLFVYRRKPFTTPVRIVVTRVLGPGERLWDADSVGRGNAKELIDALVELGWFHDDGPKWITHCDYRQDADNRKYPGTRVEVYAI